MKWLTQFHIALNWGKQLGSCLCTARSLHHLVLLAIMIAVTAGLLLFLVDPNIDSPLDGIWSAWVTMTHVGFGDVVPISFLGRLLAAGLILSGLMLFSLFTALVSVALIGESREILEVRLQPVKPEAKAAHVEDDRMLAELAKLHERMSILEKQWSSTVRQGRPMATLLPDTEGDA
jgi:hypothetical protein